MTILNMARPGSCAAFAEVDECRGRGHQAPVSPDARLLTAPYLCALPVTAQPQSRQLRSTPCSGRYRCEPRSPLPVPDADSFSAAFASSSGVGVVGTMLADPRAAHDEDLSSATAPASSGHARLRGLPAPGFGQRAGNRGPLRGERKLLAV